MGVAEYLVPRAIRTRVEIIAGLGVWEVLAVIGAGAIGYGAQALWALLRVHGGIGVVVRAGVGAMPPIVVWLSVQGGRTGGDTLFAQGRAAGRWCSGQRRYLYARASRVVG